MSLSNRMDRRHFAAQLALGAGGLTAGMTSLGQANAADDKPAQTKTDGGEPPAEKQKEEPAPATESPSAEVLLLAHLIRRYPSDYFNEEVVAGIFRDIRGDVARGKLLSDFPLKNGDEPAFVFGAYRSLEPLESGSP